MLFVVRVGFLEDSKLLLSNCENSSNDLIGGSLYFLSFGGVVSFS